MRQLLKRRAGLAPATPAVAVMLLWAVHDGGYDADTWYWGALVMLGLVGVTLIVARDRRPKLRRASQVALIAFVAYLAWSYLSMTWAQVPGWALEGSNRTLLYVLVFTLFLVIPWTREAALGVLLIFALGIGVIEIVMLVRFASHDHVAHLLVGGRLASPTGYFNSTVALFTMAALVSTLLASRRELPAPLRGLLLAMAAAGLQLSVTGESRGWLFTLPAVLVVGIIVVPDRLRVAVAAVLPAIAVLIPIHKLLHLFEGGNVSPDLNSAASSAGRTCLLLCAGVFFVATLAAWAEGLCRPRTLSRAWKLRIGVVVTIVALGLAAGGAVAATHGDPVGFVKRQWDGFTHPGGPTTQASSHFGSVGSGRWDFWRVALDAAEAHPLGGLGQDNFADYYITRRRTGEEPRWVHSFELRLLAHTGVVGALLFAVFLIAAIVAALRPRRLGSPMTRVIAAGALLPLVVWLIHGSLDWFWEVPALTGPALGFLGMAAGLGLAERFGEPPAEAVADDGAAAGGEAPTSAPADESEPAAVSRRPKRRRVPEAVPTALAWLAGTIAFVAAAIALTFPYLSVREVSEASNIQFTNPNQALADLTRAANLNPWNPDPGRLGGTIALQTTQFTEAQKRFRQAIDREPGGWYAWLGAGLAASALGEKAEAKRDFETAARINDRQQVVAQALQYIDTNHPLQASDALRELAGQAG